MKVAVAGGSGGGAARRPREHASQAARAALVGAAALALLPLLGPWIPGVWPRLAVNTAVLMPLALAAVPLPWRRLFAPTARRIGAGVAAAIVLYAMGAAVFRLLQAIPWAASQVAALYAWRDAAPDGLAVPLLPWIVLGEEVVWRTAVTLPLADRFGPGRGTALAAAGFAAAHVSLGVPLLLVVALGAGAFWSALVVSSRNVVPALVSHLLWDLAVLFLWPYG